MGDKLTPPPRESPELVVMRAPTLANEATFSRAESALSSLTLWNTGRAA